MPNPMLHDSAWVGADSSSLQGSPLQSVLSFVQSANVNWIPAVCSLPGGQGHLLKRLPPVIPSQSRLDSLEGIQVSLLAVVLDELVVVMPLLTGQHLEASKS